MVEKRKRSHQRLPSLPDDLVIEILERLSVKSLVRFRCVSKSWCNLIKSREFIHSHLQKRHTIDNKSLILSEHIGQATTKRGELIRSIRDLDSETKQVCIIRQDLASNNQYSPYRYAWPNLFGPCNGLVLITDYHRAFVCNPALRQLKSLPNRDKPNEYCPQFIHEWGFGSTSSDNYIVVNLENVLLYEVNSYPPRRRKRGSLIIEAHLYHSTTNSWRKIDDTVKDLRLSGFPTSHVFLNGACHWNATLLNQSHPGVILTLNLSTEVFGQLEYHDELMKVKDEIPYLMVMDECLAIFVCSSHIDVLCEVWVMKEYGVKESWNKQFLLALAVRRPLSLWKNGESLLIQSDECEVMSCSLRTNELERFPTCGVEGFKNLVIYKESLISLQ